MNDDKRPATNTMEAIIE
nr:hypothetical protein [Tanacetum cinerariifolium]GFA17061.1 hypothetical protein [Tanacetum cinerariifolium]